MKKVLSEFSDEELLNAIAEYEDSPEDTQEYNHDLLNFFSFYDIKPGKRPVSSKLLFKLYNSWSRNTLSLYEFRQICSNYFKKHDTRDIYYIDLKDYKLLDKFLKLLGFKIRKIKSKANRKHFESFLTWCKIKKGSSYILVKELHKIYDYWHYKTHPKNILGFSQFEDFCRLYLNVKYDLVNYAKIPWVGIDEDSVKYINEKRYKEKTK